MSAENNVKESQNGLGAPHRGIKTADEREKFTLQLFDNLWERYRNRVSYVRDYEKMIADHGGSFFNDHIAFRSIACQEPTVGIHSISRIFEALGYVAAATYIFADKNLGSIHYQHSNPKFPKLFISELRTWELPEEPRKLIRRAIKNHRDPISDKKLASLRNLNQLPPEEREKLMKTLVRFFSELPWKRPAKKDVLTINEFSQFGAWVLVHGYDVNHFTALVNSHGVDAIANIEKTVDSMKAAGIPMKSEIEGVSGSKLRQSATEAVMIDVPVREGSAETTMPWTYAYFEIAERNEINDPDTGAKRRFEGFLGPQATQLFEMTKVKK